MPTCTSWEPCIRFSQNLLLLYSLFSIHCILGPLHDLVTWHGINYTGTQITQWDFQNKGKSGWSGTSSFVLEVPLRNLHRSVIYSVPCDRIVQRVYSVHVCLPQNFASTIVLKYTCSWKYVDFPRAFKVPMKWKIKLLKTCSFKRAFKAKKDGVFLFAISFFH